MDKGSCEGEKKGAMRLIRGGGREAARWLRGGGTKGEEGDKEKGVKTMRQKR